MPSLLVVTPPGPESDTLCASLTDQGFQVSSAGTGAEAVTVARRRKPDVILMDPALSAMDRWHAVKRLNTEASTSAIPVLTLASDATSPAGLQRVVGKVQQTLGGGGRASASETIPPVAIRSATPKATLVDGQAPRPAVRGPAPVVVQVAGQVAPPTPNAKPKSREQSTGASRILVVDDNALNRDMLSRRLSRRGYSVKIAEDGQRALDMIEAETFDLVLLDWMMPGLSGIDVLKKLREDYTPMELPVIMATAKTEAEDIVEALRLDANDYVTKPLNFDVVNARMRTQLGLVNAHRQLRIEERRYRALLENTGDMIVQYRPNGDIVYVSPACRTLLGYEPTEFKSKPLYHWVHPIDRRELEVTQARQVALPPAYTFIARMKRQDQTYIWVETSCRVMRSDDEDATIQAACRDVTEHMDRLAGDEPPLPLGGDIMAHPGWRGAKGGGEKPAPAGAAPAVGPVPVVMMTLVDGVDVQSIDSDARGALIAALGNQLQQLMGKKDV